MTIENLKAQLAQTEREFEEVRAHLYRCDGVIQYLRHAIDNYPAAETPEIPDPTETPATV